jgi:hypothetical protein
MNVQHAFMDHLLFGPKEFKLRVGMKAENERTARFHWPERIPVGWKVARFVGDTFFRAV